MQKKQTILEGKRLNFSYTSEENVRGRLDASHCHDCYEILYILSGEGRYILEGSTFDIKPGTLMVIKPFEYHCVFIENGEPYERYVINFYDGAIADEALALLTEMVEVGGGKYFSANTVTPDVSMIFERFENLASLPATERDLYYKMLLSEIVILLSVSGGEKMAQDIEELGARVIKYINENIERNVSLDKLARRFFVSKYYLCRAFKKHNGISIHGYINQKRVMRAKQLIEAGETASGAAYRVGFGDYSSFYRAYVKLVGKAPTAN